MGICDTAVEAAIAYAKAAAGEAHDSPAVVNKAVANMRPIEADGWRLHHSNSNATGFTGVGRNGIKYETTLYCATSYILHPTSYTYAEFLPMTWQVRRDQLPRRVPRLL